MKVVVADTGPVHYLVLIEQIWLLPRLFERVTVPLAVRNEMLDPKAPINVQQWIADPPAWFQVLPDPTPESEDPRFAELDDGERSALQLALSIGASLVLMDDRSGVIAARSKGLLVTGTLGVLDLAADRGLVDIGTSLQRLKATNFRYSQSLIDRLLAIHQKPGQSA